MKLYKKYLLVSLLKPFFLSTLIVVGILWITQSVRYLNYLTDYDVNFALFMTMISLALPSLTIIILPIGLIITAVLGYGELIKSNELTILKNAGVKKMSLAEPFLMIAAVAIFTSCILSLHIIPYCTVKEATLKRDIKNNILNIALNQKNFNRLDNLTMYVEDRKDNILNSLFIYSKGIDGDEDVIIYARRGILQANALELVDGNIQKFKSDNSGKLSTVYFDKYALNINDYYSMDDIGEYRGIGGMNTAKLISSYFWLGTAGMKHEIIDRFFMPLLIIISLIPLTFMLNLQFSRLGNLSQQKIFFISLLLCLTQFYSVNLSKNNALGLVIFFGLLVLSCGLGFYGLREERQMRRQQKC